MLDLYEGLSGRLPGDLRIFWFLFERDSLGRSFIDIQAGIRGPCLEGAESRRASRDWTKIVCERRKSGHYGRLDHGQGEDPASSRR